MEEEVAGYPYKLDTERSASQHLQLSLSVRLLQIRIWYNDPLSLLECQLSYD